MGSDNWKKNGNGSKAENLTGPSVPWKSRSKWADLLVISVPPNKDKLWMGITIGGTHLQQTTLHNIQTQLTWLPMVQMIMHDSMLILNTCFYDSRKRWRGRRPNWGVCPWGSKDLWLIHVGHARTFTSISSWIGCHIIALWSLTKFHCLENIIIIMELERSAANRVQLNQWQNSTYGEKVKPMVRKCSDANW